MRFRRLAALAFGSVVVAVASAAPMAGATGLRAVDPGTPVTGAGATFPCNFYEQMRADVKNKLNLKVTYQCIGSGGGRANFRSGTIDFGGSDVPIPSSEAKPSKPYTYIATVLGGITIAWNKDAGIPDGLQLDGPTIGKIFHGDITNWNDAAIAGLNPGVTLPNLPITTVYRSDSSGTSNYFSTYLSAVATGQGWKAGSSTFSSSNGTLAPGGLAQNGNDGVANAVQSNPGAIGYMEYSFARERSLPIAKVKNSGGAYEKPTAATVSAALDGVTVGADGTLTFDYASLAGYPISAPSYALVYLDYGDAKKAENIRQFFGYMLGDGQGAADRLGYVPLGSALKAAALSNLAKVTPAATDTPAATTTTKKAATTTTKAATATTVATATTAATATTVAATTTGAPATTVAATTTAAPTTVADTTTVAPTTTASSGGGSSSGGVIIAILAVLALGGGGAYWFFRSKK
jgi:phosphate transport system substrate-binding protein